MFERRCLLMAPALLISGYLTSTVFGWDSRHWLSPARSTHTLLLKWGIAELKDSAPELKRYEEALIDGCNCELHELDARDEDKKLGKKYGVDVERKRIEHRGTNEGCGDIEGWWKDSLDAYRAGNKEQACFLLGIMLHMVQDMGVPAHANLVYHQGTAREFDNFEFLAYANWKPRFDDINKTDPQYDDPSKYYAFSQKWTRDDAPNYKDRNSFSKTWLTATPAEKRLLSNRQGRTCHVVKWTLNSAAKAFRKA